ncbi:MAG: elongation factor G, partial [Rhodoblastus sp.]
RRGQILGCGPRVGWEGWERLETLIPEAEMENLIVELRSATSGAGFYEARFDHLAEVTGRHAREVTMAHAAKGNGAG